jgi:excisionase family DNA binding protein
LRWDKDAATLSGAERTNGALMSDNERLAYAVSEAAALLGISRTHAYALTKTGELPTVALGRRLVVPRSKLEELLAGDQA